LEIDFGVLVHVKEFIGTRMKRRRVDTEKNENCPAWRTNP
jgi:hypothetical protein